MVTLWKSPDLGSGNESLCSSSCSWPCSSCILLWFSRSSHCSTCSCPISFWLALYLSCNSVSLYSRVSHCGWGGVWRRGYLAGVSLHCLASRALSCLLWFTRVSLPGQSPWTDHPTPHGACTSVGAEWGTPSVCSGLVFGCAPDFVYRAFWEQFKRECNQCPTLLISPPSFSLALSFDITFPTLLGILAPATLIISSCFIPNYAPYQ